MDLPQDDFIEAEVERAVRPDRGLVPDADLLLLAEMVRDLLAEDPTAAALVRAARPRATPLRSGESAAPGVAPGAARARSNKG